MNAAVSLPVPPAFDWCMVAPEDWQYLSDLIGSTLPIPAPLPSLAETSDVVVALARQSHYGNGEPLLMRGNGDAVEHMIRVVEQIDRPAPILFQQHVRAFPANDASKPPKPVAYMPMSLALTEQFQHDAHTHGYSVPDVPYRLRKTIVTDCPADTPEPLRWERTAVVMHWIFWDLDDPAAHAATGGTLEAARPTWREETARKLARLDVRHPGLFGYDTKRGTRFVYRVTGWTIASSEDEERWCMYVLGVGRYLAREYGIDADPCSRQWWNEFRLPFVKRNGVFQTPKTYGYPGAIGIWSYELTPQDAPAEDGAAVSRPKREPATFQQVDPNAEDDLIDRAGRVGMLGREISPGKLAIQCPNHRQHSTGGGPEDTSTVIWRGGALHCSHAHCTRLKIGRADLERVVTAREAKLMNLAAVETAVHTAIADGHFGPPVVVVVPPGGGKSRALRSARLSKPTILTDTHALAIQTRTRLLEDHGKDFRHEASVTAQIPGRAPCAFPKVVAEIQKAALPVGQYACARCPKKDTCEARKPIGGSDGIISVHQLVGKAPIERSIVIDEEPALTETRRITPEMVRRAAGALDRCDLDFADRVGPWIRAWGATASGGGALEDAVGYQIIRRDADAAAAAPDRKQTTIDPKTRRSRRKASVDDVEAALAQERADGMAFAPLPACEPDDPSELQIDRRWIREAGALASLRFAAKEGARITRVGEDWLVRARSPVLDAFATPSRSPACRVLLTATPTLTALRAVVPDLRVVEVAVPDGAAITRTLVEVGRLQSGKADEERILKCVDDALERARVVGCGRALVVVAKRFEEAARGRVGPRGDVAHFGALRGLDDWISCDAFVTVGDHFISRDEIFDEAALLGIDGERLWIERVQNELAQAHGRARDPSRATAAWHWHYGRVWPRGWTHENTEIVAASTGGRPKSLQLTDAELKAAVVGAGSIAEAARRFGVSRRTIERRRAKRVG